MKKHTLLAVALIATTLMFSQEAITVTGGQATGSGGSAAISVGLLMTETLSGPGGSANPGTQQSIEMETLSNIELTTLTLEAVTYPNPTQDFIVLTLKDANITGLDFTVYNISGSILTKGNVQQQETRIMMEGFAAGTYILKVNQDNIELKTFKIIKR